MRCLHQVLLRKHAEKALALLREQHVGQPISDHCPSCDEEIWITCVDEPSLSFTVAAVRRRGRGVEVIDPAFYSEREMRLLARGDLGERSLG